MKESTGIACAVATVIVIYLGIVLIVGAILLQLALNSRVSMEKFGWRFLWSTDWNPVEGRESYGAASSIFGTLVSTAIAMLLAVPLSLGIAIFLVPTPLADSVRQLLEDFENAESK